jgi:hypothetical protein
MKRVVRRLPGRIRDTLSKGYSRFADFPNALSTAIFSFLDLNVHVTVHHVCRRFSELGRLPASSPYEIRVSAPRDTVPGERLMTGLVTLRPKNLVMTAAAPNASKEERKYDGAGDRATQLGVGTRDLYRICTHMTSLVRLRIYVTRIDDNGQVLGELRGLARLTTLDIGFDRCHPSLMCLGEAVTGLQQLTLRFYTVDDTSLNPIYRPWGIGRAIHALSRLHTLRVKYEHDADAYAHVPVLSMHDDLFQLPSSLTCIDTFRARYERANALRSHRDTDHPTLQNAGETSVECLEWRRFSKLEALSISEIFTTGRLLRLMTYCPTLTTFACRGITFDSSFSTTPSSSSSSSHSSSSSASTGVGSNYSSFPFVTAVSRTLTSLTCDVWSDIAALRWCLGTFSELQYLSWSAHEAQGVSDSEGAVTAQKLTTLRMHTMEYTNLQEISEVLADQFRLTLLAELHITCIESEHDVPWSLEPLHVFAELETLCLGWSASSTCTSLPRLPRLRTFEAKRRTRNAFEISLDDCFHAWPRLETCIDTCPIAGGRAITRTAVRCSASTTKTQRVYVITSADIHEHEE